MKVLILSCNTGEGHNSAGLAIKEYFDDGGIQCDVMDALSFCPRALSSLVSRGHVFVYRRLPRLFGWGYRYEESHPIRHIYSEFAKCADGLSEYVMRHGYDTIVCVHVFASFMVSAARRRGSLRARAFFVATDYTCSPGVSELDMDAFFIPHKKLTEEFANKGVPREKIVPCGIPIHKNFFTDRSKLASRKSLALPLHARIILLSCGSMGCGPMKGVAARIANKLSEGEMLVVICGTNQALKKRLTKHFSSPRVRIIGYCTEMSEYMSAADVYMTKAGGLSTTEAIMRRLPLLCIDAVPGCETRNLEFMTGLGVADKADSAMHLSSLALDYARDERLCLMLTENMKKHFDFNSTQDLCRYILNLK